MYGITTYLTIQLTTINKGTLVDETQLVIEITTINHFLKNYT